MPTEASSAKTESPNATTAWDDPAGQRVPLCVSIYGYRWSLSQVSCDVPSNKPLERAGVNTRAHVIGASAGRSAPSR